MANEIKLSITMYVDNGSFKEVITPAQDQITQAAIGRGGSVQIIGFAAEEVVAFGDISTSGYLFLQNLDTTNFVDYGPENAGAMVALGRLKAGEMAVLRLKPGVVLRAQADTGNVKLDVRLFEN